MKICLIGSTEYPPTEGVATHVWGLAKFLFAKGHEVLVITRRMKNSNAIDNYNGILVIRPNFYPVYPFHVHLHGLFVSRIVRQLEESVDLFHFHSPLPPPARTYKPVITTFHTFTNADAGNRQIDSAREFASFMQSRVSYFIEKKLIKISSEITVASEDIQKDAKRLFPTLQKQITIIPNGVDTDFFSPGNRIIPSKSEKHYLLFVGRLDQQKGILDLLYAMKDVVLTHPEVELKIVGQGPLLPEVNALTTRLKLNNNVKYLGLISSADELRELYRHAYILICPSVYESGPRVVLECMSCQTPVIGTAVGLIPEVVRDGENGLIVTAHNPPMLAEKIINLLSSPTLRNQFSNSTREPITQRFSLESMGINYLRIYQNYCRD